MLLWYFYTAFCFFVHLSLPPCFEVLEKGPSPTRLWHPRAQRLVQNNKDAIGTLTNE